MTYEAALKMMGDVLEGLSCSEMVEPGAPLTEDAVLIGPAAILDSLGFVTFVAEVEDRLNHGRDEPLELILAEIWQFSTENPSFTAGILADYCAKMIRHAAAEGGTVTSLLETRCRNWGLADVTTAIVPTDRE